MNDQSQEPLYCELEDCFFWEEDEINADKDYRF